jgi:hypothetical protein
MKSAEEWRAHARSPDILLQAIDAEREAFSRRTRMTKLGVTLLHLVLTHLRGSAIDKGLNRWRGAVGMRRVLDVEEDGVAGLAELLRFIFPRGPRCPPLTHYVENYRPQTAMRCSRD